MNWYLTALKKYVDFQGNATRSEYWYFTLFNIIIAVALLILTKVESSLAILYGLYALATFLPSLAVTVRRLHDAGKSGWWILIAFVPLLGAFVLLYFLVQPSKK